MKAKDTWIALFVLALIISLGAVWLLPAAPSRAPDITLTTLQGDALPLAELRGQPLLVNFWATNCSGCLREMPHLIELHQDLAPQGLKIIGVAMPYDPPNRVIALQKAKNIPYDIALDIQGRAVKAFGDVRLTPSSFLIAPDGRVVQRATGELDLDSVRALILDMLAIRDIPHPQLARYP